MLSKELVPLASAGIAWGTPQLCRPPERTCLWQPVMGRRGAIRRGCSVGTGRTGSQHWLGGSRRNTLSGACALAARTGRPRSILSTTRVGVLLCPAFTRILLRSTGSCSAEPDISSSSPVLFAPSSPLSFCSLQPAFAGWGYCSSSVHISHGVEDPSLPRIRPFLPRRRPRGGVFFTEGRGVGLCWKKSKPKKDLNDRKTQGEK